MCVLIFGGGGVIRCIQVSEGVGGGSGSVLDSIYFLPSVTNGIGLIVSGLHLLSAGDCGQFPPAVSFISSMSVSGIGRQQYIFGLVSRSINLLSSSYR